MIIALKTPAEKEGKRYTAYMGDGKKIHFGLKGGQTYLEHQDKVKRINYWKRHYANPTEKRLIKRLIPSPALFSAFILWGNSSDIDKNVQYLNRLLKLKTYLIDFVL